MPEPEIVVEHPEGTEITDGATLDFGSPRTFTIRNTGEGNLTGIAVTEDGANSDNFTLDTTGTTTTLASGESTTFTVTFTPTTSGANTAAIHIASNDADENPFDINLSGTLAGPLVVTTSQDVIDATDNRTSLREAVTFANSDAVDSEITFEIPGGGSHTIALATALPSLSEDVTITGPGADLLTVRAAQGQFLNW